MGKLIMKMQCPVCGKTQDSSQGTSHTHTTKQGWIVNVPLSIVIECKEKETHARHTYPRQD